MRFTFNDNMIDIVFCENEVNCIYLENPQLMTELVYSLYNQTNGGVGKFILSDGLSEKSISKNMDLVINPFEININNKKVIGKLHEEIRARAIEDYYIETNQINTQIVSYLEKISNDIDYNIDFNLDMDIIAVLKAFSVRVYEYDTTLSDRIASYMKVMHKICGFSIFVFVGLKQYLSEDEITELYKLSFYEKLNIIDIESHFERALENEKILVIDKDLCQIII